MARRAHRGVAALIELMTVGHPRAGHGDTAFTDAVSFP